MRMKRTLFSIVLLAAFAVQGLYAKPHAKKSSMILQRQVVYITLTPVLRASRPRLRKVMNHSISVTMAVMVPAG